MQQSTHRGRLVCIRTRRDLRPGMKAIQFLASSSVIPNHRFLTFPSWRRRRLNVWHSIRAAALAAALPRRGPIEAADATGSGPGGSAGRRAAGPAAELPGSKRQRGGPGPDGHSESMAQS